MTSESVASCRTISADREIAYRAGRRMVPRLEKIDLRNRRGYVPKGVAFQTGGMYVITGGLRRNWLWKWRAICCVSIRLTFC
jgi:hypothetical protein